MKRSDNNINSSKISWMQMALIWGLPILLLVPNIVLDFTESYPPLVKVANIVLPLGVYLWMMAAGRRPWRMTFLFIPLMVICAFQIVLLYLYGESIIAIDMYLNLVTTNVGEATELLGNLVQAIVAVVVFYIPPIAFAVTLSRRGADVAKPRRTIPQRVGMSLIVAGCVLLGACYAFTPGFRIQRSIFPVNVVSNIFEAIHRTSLIDGYQKASADFDFIAECSRPDSLPEIYVLVIGETSRADNWQLYGYDRPTNPRLSQRDDLLIFPKALSESNTTHKSVPLLVSACTSHDYADSIYTTKSLVTAFADCGYLTAWLSNQQHNHSMIDFFSREADVCEYLADANEGGESGYDMELVPALEALIRDAGPGRKVFAVLHTYGSHFDYRERYPEEYQQFIPDNSSMAVAANRQGLVNAYDNTIIYTDAVLDSVMNMLASTGRPAAMLYISDHGEDIFDDARNRFLHASPSPTYWQLHVPMLMWMSDSYREMCPKAYGIAEANRMRDISTGRSVFDTMLALAGIHTRLTDSTKSLIDTAYTEPERVYLDDYCEAVPLKKSGLRKPDFEKFSEKGFSF